MLMPQILIMRMIYVRICGIRILAPFSKISNVGFALMVHLNKVTN